MNKKKNLLLKILSFLFAIFLLYYILVKTGYYEYKVYTKTKLTQEAIKQFEKDISENKNVKIEDYIEDNTYDYSNVATNIGDKIGMSIETIMNEGIKKSLSIVSNLFYK